MYWYWKSMWSKINDMGKGRNTCNIYNVRVTIGIFLFFIGAWKKTKQNKTGVFLPGESQGRGSLVGCRPWGRAESDTTEAT